jgi:hypothetical protein
MSRREQIRRIAERERRAGYAQQRCRCGHARAAHEEAYRQCTACAVTISPVGTAPTFTCEPGHCDRFTWVAEGGR